MGSGKTTIGKQLASRLGYQFIDQDEVIEKRFGMTVTDVFGKLGESVFREAEHDVLKNLSETDNVVVSTGGGAPCFHNNIELMNQLGETIYLKGDPKTLMHRVKNTGATRPLIRDKSEAELLDYITSKLNERDPIYSQAKYTILTLNLCVDDVLQIVREIDKQGN